jgi:phage tail-like protein
VTISLGQDPLLPFPGFNFHVEIELSLFDRVKDSADPSGGVVPKSVITGGFSEISGLEASMEAKVIRSGGENYRVYQRAGPITFAPVVLKRGIVSSRHIWAWWSLFAGANHALNGGWAGSNRADVSVFLIRPKPAGNGTGEGSSPGREAVVGWTLSNAMPVKFRVGDLNASGDEVAVEELHLAHEGLHAEALT